MGTPASVVSEPPPWQTPTEARGRKQASANIFQDAELLQIQGLFQRSGDQLAEERAQIIWECAGDHRVADALRRLRRKRPPRQKLLGHSLHHCRRLRSLPAQEQGAPRDRAEPHGLTNHYGCSLGSIPLLPSLGSTTRTSDLNRPSEIRIPESHAPAVDPQSSATEMASGDQYLNSRRTSARIRRNWRKPGPTSYLHQIRH
nr:PREDICTED: arginine vasopressin-induced protein 1 isoform X2 [Rhinolophus sinicus]XP_019580380.1 PREDICTED: arginine vasopressin-induced protein 1 isoform X2 [Rhinolophus sinicus]XP_019580381.1 PREDICTED: arginine vasopressin-induced protein 1 isoform X2 [Rhinolophus sinicus]XP_019580382.1 PREDICTED: arginine vasopressin-induced protein 1 isoform X2 [Rhinolophus sinicus]XP_019580383.1 PREDICTED: arginine vasopressin-induced protein 1 isoform X2 [Rhinolophus sinicus]XP_019580384.1 PREDICTED: